VRSPAPNDDAPGGYRTSLEHLTAELDRLEVLLRVHVGRLRERGADADAPLAAFYISDDEVDALLDRTVGAAPWSGVPLPDDEAAAVGEALVARSREIEARVARSLADGVWLRLVALAHLFALSNVDVDVVVLCLAPELDRRYELLYAYLQDDATRRELTVALVLDLLGTDLAGKVVARSRFGPQAPLVTAGLVQLGAAPTLLARTVRLHPRVAAYLLDDDQLDEELRTLVRLESPTTALADLVLPADCAANLDRLAHRAPDDAVIYLQGPRGVGKRSAARACCAAWGVDLLVVDGRRATTHDVDEFAALVGAVDREARLQGAALYWNDVDALLADDRTAQLDHLLATLNARPGPTFLAGRTVWEPAGALPDVAFARVEVPAPGHVERLRLWRAALDGTAASADLATLAGMFRLTGAQIHDAAATARNRAHARDPDDPRVSADDLQTACRLRSNRRLAELARPVVPRRTWEDLVLPADRMAVLREIHDQVRHRALVHETWGFRRTLALGRGLNVLFSGPPGTGKTMAVEVLAGALGLDMYAIDLSRVVSKYLGETEKNLARIFDEARTSNAILFFDEADALFGKRTQVRDAHDRYANVEVSYLLQKMEEHEGVVVLATNLRKNLDEAFVRRLHFMVEFPQPDAADRQRIWERIWPADTPRDPDIDLDLLAREIDVSGGSIRNIAVAGAFLAAADGGRVTMEHLLQATQREYQKMGKVLGTAAPGALPWPRP
jgi:Winged helix domain, variant/ATPase family associated with various cellular activities (AAA)